MARAYVDQLGRNGALSPERARAISAGLDRAEEALSSENRANEEVAGRLDVLAADVEGSASGAVGRDQARLRSLAENVKGIAQSLREGPSGQR